MTYCREGHTLIDNEAEAGWERLVPGTEFQLLVNAVTYFGVVDEYSSPTPTTLYCRLYSDAPRTILVTTPIPLALPYEVSDFVSFAWRKDDLNQDTTGDIGAWVSAPVIVRDDTGVWTGTWVAEPKTEAEDSEVEFKFEGTHTLFTATVEEPIISEQAGAGLGAGTYQYCVVPVDGAARLGAGSRILTVTLAGAADVFIDWLPNNQVSSWNVYGRQLGGTFGLMTNLPGATVSYLDSGVDVPNPAFQPPLFEDPAWTAAVANKTVSITDNGITSDGDISEDAVELTDVGQTIADSTDVGGFVLDNTNEGLQFDITGLESTVQVTENVVLDPNLFINDPLPPNLQPPYVVQYDYHVYFNSDGDLVIEETDSQTGQTKRLTLNQVDGTILVQIIENSVVISTSTVALDPLYVIPAPGSLSTTITYNNIRVLGDGTILGRETVEVNTYNVAPISIVGQMVVVDSDFFGAPHRVRYSNDGAATWINYDPTARLTIPGGFSLQRSDFFWASGEGWTVIGSVDNVTVSLVTDVALHWTNDITAVAWPFNDAVGRVAGGDIGAAAFGRIQKNGTQMPGWDIRSVGALGPMMYQCGSVDNHQASLEEFVCFFPPSGVMSTIRFDSVGGVNLQAWAVWPEKNMLVGIEQGPTSNVHTWDFSASEVAPLTNHQQPANLPVKLDNNNPYKICCGANEIFVIYEQEVSSNIYVSRSSDGASWSHVINNNTNSWDRTIPGQEVLGMLPHSWAYNATLGKYLHLDLFSRLYESTDGTTWTVANDIFTDHGGERADNDSWEPFEGGFGGTTDYPLMYDSNLDILCIPRYPGFTPTEWSGTWLRLEGAALDTEKIPFIGGASGGAIRVERGMMGGQIGQSGSPNGIPAANLRRYIGRAVVIPNDVAQPDSPFVIRDTAASEVYGGRNTRNYQSEPGDLVQIIQSDERGGAGNTTYTKYDNGQVILRDIPGNLPDGSIEFWRNPPVNMRWTSKY